jgi:hypothetical protein
VVAAPRGAEALVGRDDLVFGEPVHRQRRTCGHPFTIDVAEQVW